MQKRGSNRYNIRKKGIKRKREEPKDADQPMPSVKEKICRALDIPPDVFLRETLVEIRGRNSIAIRGGGKISFYTDREIRVLIACGELKVWGYRLTCGAYRRGDISVEGLICGVSFEEEKR